VQAAGPTKEVVCSTFTCMTQGSKRAAPGPAYLQRRPAVVRNAPVGRTSFLRQCTEEQLISHLLCQVAANDQQTSRL
jgi:hypothetical protein